MSALRLDVVLKEMIHKLKIAQQLIIKRVKVNHTVIDSTDFQLEQNHFVNQVMQSYKIVEIGGKTKRTSYTLIINTIVIAINQGGLSCLLHQVRLRIKNLHE